MMAKIKEKKDQWMASVGTELKHPFCSSTRTYEVMECGKRYKGKGTSLGPKRRRLDSTCMCFQLAWQRSESAMQIQELSTGFPHLLSNLTFENDSRSKMKG
jgi:hypothetical protein